jgi:ATP-dependent protease HslVU (ClpYQ) peptidase subunit
MKINYAELNEDHCRRVDKFYRQFAGLSSEIISFNTLTIELEIKISKRWKKDPTTTAVQIAKDWRSYHDCLITARFYKVTLVFLNPDQETGGVLSSSQNQDRSSLVQEIQNLI